MAKIDDPSFESELKQAQKDSVRDAFAKTPSADGLADIGIDAIDTAETFLKQFYEEDPPEQPLACAAGCTFCCHQYVGLSMPELAILTKFIRSNFKDAQIEVLKNRLAEVLEKTKDMSRFERTASKIDCPLLDQSTRQCSVYTERPLTYRAMHSLDRDACEADDATPGKNHPIPQYQSHKVLIQSIAIGLQLGLADNDIEPKELELTSALLLTLSKAEAIDGWIEDQAEFDGTVVPKE